MGFFNNYFLFFFGYFSAPALLHYGSTESTDDEYCSTSTVRTRVQKVQVQYEYVPVRTVRLTGQYSYCTYCTGT